MSALGFCIYEQDALLPPFSLKLPWWKCNLAADRSQFWYGNRNRDTNVCLCINCFLTQMSVVLVSTADWTSFSLINCFVLAPRGSFGEREGRMGHRLVTCYAAYKSKHLCIEVENPLVASDPAESLISWPIRLCLFKAYHWAGRLVGFSFLPGPSWNCEDILKEWHLGLKHGGCFYHGHLQFCQRTNTSSVSGSQAFPGHDTNGLLNTSWTEHFCFKKHACDRMSRWLALGSLAHCRLEQQKVCQFYSMWLA